MQVIEDYCKIPRGMFSIQQISALASRGIMFSFVAKGRYSETAKSNSGKVCLTASQNVLTKVKILSSLSKESQTALPALLATCASRVVLP